MSSPFPGMAPFLEHPDIFPDLHDRLNTHLSFIYPIQLEQRLPQIDIPLLPGDPAVTVDLQAVLDHCYEAAPYAREVSYQTHTPVPPLRPDQQEWAKGLLRRTAPGSL